MHSLILVCMVGLAVAYPQGNYKYLPPSVRADIPTVPPVVTTPAPFSAVPRFSQKKLVKSPPPHPKEIISKYFFIHGAQEDKEDASELESLGPVNKQFKVVFIKSPEEDLQFAARAIAKARNHEKTSIYVLTKKVAPTELNNALESLPSPDNKPKVHFIQYSTPQEALNAQKLIQAQYDALGGTSVVSDEGLAPITSVVGSLENVALPAVSQPSLTPLPGRSPSTPLQSQTQATLATVNRTYLPA